ncbi:Serine/threonine-protein kinase afc2 [Castilleja foliolosa]|uniref:NADH dehydrogenase [ubiquinone] 1 beta subcomplex subunit 9 n=1 Tax=Castilleja foliolosa TaxID=1961234 RepID=A0ABD3BCI4_9LAMI
MASYLFLRATQKERVRILYRRALKDTLNWAVHRHLFYHDADALRERFETNKNVAQLGLFSGQEIGYVTSYAPPTALSDHPNSLFVKKGVARNGSPPWREDDKDGHYVFAIGDN